MKTAERPSMTAIVKSRTSAASRHRGVTAPGRLRLTMDAEGHHRDAAAAERRGRSPG